MATARAVTSTVDASDRLRNCSTSARSTRSREHSVAAARAFATARSLLTAAQRHTPRTEITPKLL